ncbi:Gravitropic in the light [Thalictrum thalictroides]|uniref:Gravitropic in the light n=1 Tax=Thalictrum thalictroides TaxID=46969 RepID=A0A7J6WER1_THATH|nr:Gravitropic in the light [Thalictrum thalictroides]
MPDMDPSTKQPQISEMFQKFALAFKTKTIEFFAEEDEEEVETLIGEDFETLSLLDSAEENITGQRVVVIKPDSTTTPTSIHLPQTLISSVFATISSFEASYVQLQTAHSPFNAENIESADRLVISHLQKLSDMKKWYKEFRKTACPNLLCPNLSVGSHLEAQVQENQSLLRTLEMLVNRLQLEIDSKDAEVLIMKQKLKKSVELNSKLSKRLPKCKVDSFTIKRDKLLSITAFDSVLRYVCKSCHRFTKILIDLMKKVGWDLDSAANSVYPDVEYEKIGHNQYAFLSYVCLGMFQGFDSAGFGLKEDEFECKASDYVVEKNKRFLRQFVEHATGDAIEILNNDSNGCFARFCELKYQKLVHPTMECSLFKSLDQNDLVLSLWRSSAAFYQTFVDMASSVWMLHKLAFSFDPIIEIFQVERGVDFSMIYMENVTGKAVTSDKTRLKVAFTVIPGFKIGRTIIQSQVYLKGAKIVE